MKRILAATAACTALAACGGPAPAPQPISPGAEPSATVVLTDCGTFDLPQGERLPGAAGQCLVDAVEAGRPARLKVTRPTVEGDPITVTYAAGADGRVQVVNDATQDKFGSQTITRRTCTGPELDFAECSEA